MNTGVSLPKYLTEHEFKKILDVTSDKMDTKWKDLEHYKKAWKLYWETGCRLAEPFDGELYGNWLVVSAERSKSRIPRQIQLTDSQSITVQEMKKRFGAYKGQGPYEHIKLYSRVFKSACKAAGIDKHLHCLRHTFGVRRWYETGDIYLVSREMGHTLVTTTENYTKFEMGRLEGDFPTVSKAKKRAEKRGKLPIVDTFSVDTPHIVLHN